MIAKSVAQYNNRVHSDDHKNEIIIFYFVLLWVFNNLKAAKHL